MFSLLVLMSCFLSIHMLAENFSLTYNETMFSADSVFTATDKLSCAHLCYFKYGCCVMFAFKEVEKTCHISRTIGDLIPSSQGIAVYTREIDLANYTITVQVGDGAEEGSNAAVSVVFVSSSCDSSSLELDVEGFDDFAPGSNVSYLMRDVDIGELIKIRFRIKMIDISENFFIVRMTVVKQSDNDNCRGKNTEIYRYDVNGWVNSTGSLDFEKEFQHDSMEYH